MPKIILLLGEIAAPSKDGDVALYDVQKSSTKVTSVEYSQKIGFVYLDSEEQTEQVLAQLKGLQNKYAALHIVNESIFAEKKLSRSQIWIEKYVV